MWTRGRLVLATVLSLSACDGFVGEGPADESTARDTTTSAIQHLVVIVQENHSFDNYFGTYCTAATGSNPSCNIGPGCCEAGPARDPGSGESPFSLTDSLNANFDPNETQSCQVTEMDGGRMDDYVNASCGHYANFAYAPASLVATYRNWAQQYAIGDRYFQPVAGASSSNDLYFAQARFAFVDDTYEPQAIGHGCSTNRNTISYSTTSLGDVLNAHGVSWSWYAEGYNAMVNSWICPGAPSDCPWGLPTYPCIFDPGDIPQDYFRSTADSSAHLRDLSALSNDLKNTLPQVVFIKGLGYHSEHPAQGTKISQGVSFVSNIVGQIQRSKYAASTLILLTYDESGGWFDHVAPPPASAVDGQPYGARVPLIAIGPFVRTNFVSHVTMEHSSIVKFVEWNWLGATGQLGARDAVVSNIGSLLDPTKTGVTVPQ